MALLGLGVDEPRPFEPRWDFFFIGVPFAPGASPPPRLGRVAFAMTPRGAFAPGNDRGGAGQCDAGGAPATASVPSATKPVELSDGHVSCFASESKTKRSCMGKQSVSLRRFFQHRLVRRRRKNRSGGGGLRQRERPHQTSSGLSETRAALRATSRTRVDARGSSAEGGGATTVAAARRRPWRITGSTTCWARRTEAAICACEARSCSPASATASRRWT